MRKRDPLIISCLLCIITISYLPTLSGNFILDDYPLVKYNTFIREFQSPASYLSQEDAFVADRSGDYHSGYYRPLINFLYTVDYKIWGMVPSKFRMTNLILHLFTCLFLYQLLRLFAHEGMGPFWVVLVFGLHPANTEAVSWITSRNNIVVTLFSILSFTFYVKNDLRPSKWARMLCLLCFSMALLSKEFALMLLPIFFLYDQIMGKKRITRALIYGYLAIAMIVISYLFLRHFATQSVVPLGDAWHILRGLYFLPFLIAYNLRIIFLPFGLHNFILTYPESYLGWNVCLGWIVLGIMAWLLCRYQKNRILLFSWLSSLLALFPVLHVFPTAAVSLVSMRWLYFPMAFLCIAAAGGVPRILNFNKLTYRHAIAGLVVFYLGAYSYVLNENLWKNETRFFKQEVLGFHNEFYLTDLATVYHSEGKNREALQYFEKALQKRTNRASELSLYINYAALLLDVNRFQEALTYLDKAERLRPLTRDQARLDNNRGVAYFRMGDYRNAIRYFQKAIGSDPGISSVLINLANAYSASGRYPEAVSLYKKALGLDPGRISVKKAIGMTYMKMGDYVKALRSFEEIPQEIRGKDPETQRMLEEARKRVASIHSSLNRAAE